MYNPYRRGISTSIPTNTSLPPPTAALSATTFVSRLLLVGIASMAAIALIVVLLLIVVGLLTVFVGAIVQADAQNTVDTIVYEAVQFHPADGWGGDRFGECLSPNDHCTSFNVYYKTENFDGSTTTHMLRSKHQ